jgi:F0F1-type ATP synthase delta subunit
MWTTLAYLVVTQLVVLGVILIVLKQVLLRDTLNAVNRLRESEAELGKKEEAIRRKIEENEAEYRRKSAEAQEALAREREIAERDLARMRDNLVEEAKKERDRILNDAQRSKEKMRQELAQELDAKSIEYAGSVYELVFSEEIAGKLNVAFLEELLAAMEDMDAASINVRADEVEVEASHPLDGAHKERIRDLIARKFNVALDVREKVVPKLLAGLKLKLGSLEIDGSLQNRFHEAVEELKRERA